MNQSIGIGLCLGVVFGVAFDNLALGLCLGLAIGTGFGCSSGRKGGKDSQDPDKKRQLTAKQEKALSFRRGAEGKGFFAVFYLPWARGGWPGAAASNQNTLPWPTVLSTPKRKPWLCRMALVMERPRPLPTLPASWRLR